MLYAGSHSRRYPSKKHWKRSFYTKALHITLFKIYPLARPFQPPTRLVHFAGSYSPPFIPSFYHVLIHHSSSSSILKLNPRYFLLFLLLLINFLNAIRFKHGQNYRSIYSTKYRALFCTFLRFSQEVLNCMTTFVINWIVFIYTVSMLGKIFY